jgi:hypothetical protein
MILVANEGSEKEKESTFKYKVIDLKTESNNNIAYARLQLIDQFPIDNVKLFKEFKK